jgi:nucleoprotein TPR
MEDRDQQARAAREANHSLQSKQKEIDLLNKQQVDLSRQVRGLMHQLARALDPSLPDEFIEEARAGAGPSSSNHTNNNNGMIDADSFVSSNLVLLRDLPHLQQQNMTLLKLTRSLASQLEELERKGKEEEEESEMMSEARLLIESLQIQLKTSQAKMEAYIKERDVFKAMASRRSGGGAETAESTSNTMAVDGAVDYHQKFDEEHAALEALKRETAKDFETLRGELRQAKAESTDLHVALGKARATVEYHIGDLTFFFARDMIWWQWTDVTMVQSDINSFNRALLLKLTNSRRSLAGITSWKVTFVRPSRKLANCQSRSLRILGTSQRRRVKLSCCGVRRLFRR